MTVTELRILCQRMEIEGNGNLEVWSDHPEAGIMWGPIQAIGAPCVTDQFQMVALIETQVPPDEG